MGVQKSEVEITSSVPGEKLYKALCLDIDTLLPQVVPGAVKSAEILEGDGGVGTIKLVTLGDASPFKTMKQKITVIDKEALTFSYDIIGGDLLLGFIECINNHFSIVHNADGSCTAKSTIIFNTRGDTVVPEENIKYAVDTNNAIFKAVEAHLRYAVVPEENIKYAVKSNKSVSGLKPSQRRSLCTRKQYLLQNITSN